MVFNDNIRFTGEKPYIDYLEWEGLQKEYEIGKYDKIKTRLLPQSSKKLVISRDKEYKINGELTGDFENQDELVPINFELKNPKNSQIYNLSDLKVLNYEFKGTFTNLLSKLRRDGNHKFVGYLDIEYVRKDYNNSSKIGWLTEWFLNGRNINYGGTIRNKLLKKYDIEMGIPEYPNIGYHKLNLDFFDLNHSFSLQSNDSKGYIFVAFKDENEEDKYFTIQSVPDIYGPSWSNNVSIEYKSEWWIPSHEERLKINEIVSFLIGRQLISVGYTKYDKRGYSIEEYSNKPDISDGINLQDLCEKKEMSCPVNTVYTNNPWSDNLGVYFNKLIPEYFVLRDELNLHEVLEKYWLSQALPKEAEMIVMASCLESLFNAWYKSKQSKSRRKYLPKEKFDDIIMNYCDSIQEDLKEYFDSVNNYPSIDFGEKPDFTDKILRKILNSYLMGYNQSIDFFFKEIGLPINRIEKKAIKYRNKPVHGGITGDDYDNLHKMTNAYRTLVNRTILKILGYDNKYIDYHRALDSVPLEEYIRHIDEPMD